MNSSTLRRRIAIVLRRHWLAGYCSTCTIFICLFALTASGQQTPTEAEQRQFFEQKIRPVLVQHCYSCHSADALKNKKLQAGLLLDSAAGTLAGPRLVSIGPVTSEALRELGARPDVEAAVHTPDGLVDALIGDAAERA